MNEELLDRIATVYRRVIQAIPELPLGFHNVPHIEQIVTMIYNVGYMDGVERIGKLIDEKLFEVKKQ